MIRFRQRDFEHLEHFEGLPPRGPFIRSARRGRIGDANLCSGNTNAAAIMIGEKASDHIRGMI
jgi:hypothetical protein